MMYSYTLRVPLYKRVLNMLHKAGNIIDHK